MSKKVKTAINDKEIEWVTPLVFRKRLGMTCKLYREYVRNGRIVEKVVNRIRRVDWNENLNSLLETSRNPARYSTRGTPVLESGLAEKARKFIQENLKKGSPVMETKEPEDVDQEFSSHMKKREAEAVKQLYQAKAAKLKFLKDAGLLIPVDQVKEEWKEIAITLKKQMLSLPDRLSELMASITDSEEIRKLLNKEITHILKSFKYEIRKDGEEGTEKEK